MTPATAEKFPLSIQAPIYAVAFFTGNLFPMISVVMPLWALELGASPFVIGLIIASRQIFTVTLSIHSGALLDRYGPRQVILILGMAGACTIGLFPVLPFIWAAIALQMVSGFCETTNWIGAQAAVGRLLKGHAIYAGRMTAAARTGGFIGPWTIGLTWQYVGPFGAFSFLAIWVLLGSAAAWFLPSETPALPEPEAGNRKGPEARSGEEAGNRKGQERKTRAADVMPKLSDYATAFRLLVIPAVALVILATAMRQTGSGIQSSFYGVWLKEIGFTGGTIGFLIGISNAVSAVSALSIGPLTRRWATHWLLLITITLAVAAIAITPMLGITPTDQTFTLLVVAICMRGVGQGLNLPLMISIAGRAVGRDLQGRVVALRVSFNRFGGALVPIFMGALAEVIGLEYAFYAVGATGIVLIAFLTLWVIVSPNFQSGGGGRPPPG